MAAPKTWVAGETITATDLNTVSGVAGMGGMVLVTPTSVAGTGVSLSGSVVNFSGSSTISVNGCFSSTYDNYRIMWNGLGSSAGLLLMRMRSAGTDRTAADYAWWRNWYGSPGTGNGGVYGDTSMTVASVDVAYNGMSLDLFAPYLARYTTYTAQATQQGASYIYGITLAGNSTAASSFDGFSLVASAGTMTGSLQIYGYRKS